MDRRIDGVSETDKLAAAYVSARDATALLGVKLPTLYTYVSRGLIKSIPGPGRRGRLYLRADLALLKVRHDARAGHAAVAAAALSWGEPILDSAITAIDGDGPWYRGHSAIALASSGVSFEAVAEHLWGASAAFGDGPDARLRWHVDDIGYAAGRLAAALPRPGEAPDILHRMGLALAALVAADVDARGPDERERARRLLVRLRAAPALPDKARRARALGAASMAKGVLAAFGARASDEAVAIVNGCLVLCADHELNASTFAARVAASAGCDLYGCLTAALAVIGGARHGGITRQVDALVADVGGPSRATAVVRERTRRREAVPGFGHRLYPAGDPRAEPLLAFARLRKGQGDIRLDTLLAVVDAMRDLGREAPTLDLGLVALSYALALPPGAPVALFALGRAAGWVAHVLEERAVGGDSGRDSGGDNAETPRGRLLRPRARYVGVGRQPSPAPR